jgi:hypothetical protein
MTGKRKKSGRKENVLRIRLADNDRAALDAAAAEKSLDTSTWARSELLTLAKGRAARRMPR